MSAASQRIVRTRLKHLGRIVSGGTPQSGNPAYWGGPIPWLTPVDLGNDGGDRIAQSDRSITEAGLQEAGLEILPIGSVVVSTRAPIGSVGLLAAPATTNQGCKALIPKNDRFDGRFAYYWFHDHAERLQSLGQGTTFLELSTFAMKNVEALVPPIAEQRRIAAWLDEKTAKIDRLIELRRKQIDLLEGQLASSVQEVVSFGLDRTATLFESGLPWIGKVPSHWEIRPIKRTARILRGKFSHRPRSDPALYGGKHPFVQTGDVATSGKHLTSFSQTLNDRGLEVSTKFPKGTLLMAIAANIGDVSILGFDACLPDSVVGFFPVTDVEVEFLYYALFGMQEQLSALAPENTQQNLNVDRLGQMKVKVPPVAEQRAICSYLVRVERETLRLEEGHQRQISLLSDYRASIIHEAVTGQLNSYSQE